jgi:hypothetical protein
MVKTPPLRSARLDLAFLGLGGVGERCRFSSSAKDLLVAIAEHRHDEAALRADGDADVVEMVLHDLIAIDADIDGRDRLEGLDDGFHEEGHEAELDAVLGDKAVLQLGAQGHDGAHVALVEGGEDGGGLLGADELVGDLAAQRRHLLARDAAFGGAWRELGGGRGLGGLWEPVPWGGFARAGLRGRGAGWGAGCEPASRARVFPLSPGRRRAPFRDAADHGADFDIGTFGEGDAQFAAGFGGDFRRDLVGLEREQDVAGLDVVAGFEVPFGDLAAGDGFAEGGDFDVGDGRAREWGIAGKGDSDAEGILDELFLLEDVDGLGTGGGAGAAFAAGVAQLVVGKLLQARADVVEGAHVAGFLLAPDPLFLARG